jgi:hypothetical protein
MNHLTTFIEEYDTLKCTTREQKKKVLQYNEQIDKYIYNLTNNAQSETLFDDARESYHFTYLKVWALLISIACGIFAIKKYN